MQAIDDPMTIPIAAKGCAAHALLVSEVQRFASLVKAKVEFLLQQQGDGWNYFTV